jgi:acetyl esterase/lipase
LAAVTRTTVRYGRDRGQVAELWMPAAATGRVPVVVLVHGGFWRSHLGKILMRPLARAVVAEGWAAWNVEYRRVGPLGGGGGWPATLTDVGAAVDALAGQPGLDLDRVVSCGHSAGGQLALWLGARPGLAGTELGGPVAVPVTAAVSIAGVSDLRAAFELDVGRGAVAAFLGGSPDEVPDRYDLASPAARLPLGVPQVLVHGLDDTAVPPAMSAAYVDAAQAAGDDATYVPLPGVSHRDALRTSRPAWRVTVEHLRRLLAA